MVNGRMAFGNSSASSSSSTSSKMPLIELVLELELALDFYITSLLTFFIFHSPFFI
jgi:hypothetical protein